MNDSAARNLLPEGLRDGLPPDAGKQARVIDRLRAGFAANGYLLVEPPLVEFEETILSGVGAATASQIFRMLDPVSHRTLGVRTDMTTQVARIAATRLSAAPRPLRLMYAGQVLRVKGTQLEPERQFTQAGIELIGAETGAADAEVMIVVAEGLKALGIGGVSIDLALPTLVPAILAAHPVAGGNRENLRAALDHKDVAAIQALAGAASPLLTALVEASGPFQAAAGRIGSLDLPTAARAEWTKLADVARVVSASAPDLTLTVDAVENRGFEYHTGITFSVFAHGVQREIGRGGRYRLGPGGEAATGATLLVDALLGVSTCAEAGQKVFVGAGTPRMVVSELQKDGWAVIAGLAASDAEADAVRLGCSHVLVNGTPKALKKQGS